MSFLGSETFFTPQSIAECANPTHSLSLSSAHSPSKNTHICSHFLPQRAASEIITADAMQGMGGGSRREDFLSSPDLLLLLFCLSFHSFVFIPNTSLRLFLSLSLIHIHLLTSCTHKPLALDHCVLITGLAGYIGQTA